KRITMLLLPFDRDTRRPPTGEENQHGIRRRVRRAPIRHPCRPVAWRPSRRASLRIVARIVRARGALERRLPCAEREPKALRRCWDGLRADHTRPSDEDHDKTQP